MRKLTLPIVLALVLGPAAVAAAKEPVAAKVCGPSACHIFKDRDTLFAIGGGDPGQPPASGAPWYSVRMVIKIDDGRHDSFPVAILPSTGVTRYGDPNTGYTWVAPSTRAARVYRRITRGMEPFAAAKLEGVGPVEAKVDEVVQPPKPEPAAADGGGSSPLPWIAGGLVLVGVVFALIRWRGRLWPRPAQG